MINYFELVIYAVTTKIV